MGDIGHHDLAAAAQQLGREARAASVRMDERRAALARSALVWWEGGAAEAYQQAVQERVTALSVLSRRLGTLADAYDELAAEARLAAVVERVVADAAGARMP
ncbi:MAG TPA: hypothetical protein VLQ78_06640 [Ornithinibacter sp.]|nr:hypothetical protein [Ornithinibacter sp.]